MIARNAGFRISNRHPLIHDPPCIPTVTRLCPIQCLEKTFFHFTPLTFLRVLSDARPPEALVRNDKDVSPFHRIAKRDVPIDPQFSAKGFSCFRMGFLRVEVMAIRNSYRIFVEIVCLNSGAAIVSRPQSPFYSDFFIDVKHS